MEPFRHLKNGFPPEAEVGRDPYGIYSVYSLLTASFFGLAALFADDDIPEASCPAEIGGYVFILPDAFHKVFATCAGSHVEIDLRADAHHDATGLGRFAVAGAPIELGPGMPITATPSYMLPDALRTAAPLAVGPAWPDGDGWQSLAALGEGLTAQCMVMSATTIEVAFTVTYAWTDVEIRETYRLSAGRVYIHTAVSRAGAPVERLRFQMPLLVTDGDAESAITETSGTTVVQYRDATLVVNYDDTYAARLDEMGAANRNGVYRALALEADSGEIDVELLLEIGD